MTINVGDSLPQATLVKATQDGPDQVDTQAYFAGRTVALFAVPGAYTPTCSARHLPSFVEKADSLTAKGVDEIACLSVNDAFVMSAWAKANDATGITMFADWDASFTKALGLEMDGHKFGLGTRSQRYAMLVEDGVVKRLDVEAPGEYKVSSAEHLLEHL